MPKRKKAEKTEQLQPEQLKIDLFKGKHEVRKIFHQDEWWFSVVDVVGILSEADNPRRYWSDLKRKIKAEGSFQLYEKIVQLKLESSDGKKYPTDCANTETMLRIVQSIPSKNAEPFKRWLAKVGFERMQEIEQPGLAVKRARATYLMKGYDDEWIERRIHNIQKREELTDEWKDRGVEAGREYAILTAEISEATFGYKPSEYKNIKGLDKRDNLRDHMTPLELIFSTLGEVATKEITVNKDAQGFNENREAAKDGGKIAGDARHALEKKTRKRVVSTNNYKELTLDKAMGRIANKPPPKRLKE
ncbi:Bro-N domain-containing protein [bacterium]|nr:Bro-N domain-containing protein [bacterium]